MNIPIEKEYYYVVPEIAQNKLKIENIEKKGLAGICKVK